MNKPPLTYKNKAVGYIDDIIINNDIVESVRIYLYYDEQHDFIVNEIMTSSFLSFGKFVNMEDVRSNQEYTYEFDDYDYLTIKLKEK